ncbi:MAG: hypothetical protein ACRCZ9_11705 [Fusobacteriaceae bacterium]
MIIDSLASTKVYVEKKSLLKIIGNSETNNDGFLRVDSSGNKLISNIDSGDTPLYRLEKYSGSYGLMLYNPTTKNIQIAQQGDFLNVGIDFDKGTRYFIGARRIKSISHLKNTFTLDLGDSRIFKVFMDGREIKNYSVTNNSITLNGNESYLIDMFSELVVYTYLSNEVKGSVSRGVMRDESVASPVVNVFSDTSYDAFVMEYYQYPKIWDYELFLNEEYFEGGNIIPLYNFNEASITQNVSRTTYRSGFSYSMNTRINSVENTVELNTFEGNDRVDMVRYVGNDEFRLVFANPAFGRFVLLNNCKADGGGSIMYNKEKNTRKVSLHCGNYVDIVRDFTKEYGSDEYSEGVYGGGLSVYNSHRKSGGESW